MARPFDALTTTWLLAVGVHTASHRMGRAKRLRQLGGRRQWELRRQGLSEAYVRDSVRWYEQRARAQEDRIHRVLDCGADVLVIECPACGLVNERTNGCKVGLLCPSCRGAIAATKRAAFLAARAVVVADVAKRGLFWPYRRGGRWSEKFVTLTAPHVVRDSVRSRVERILEAWPRLLRFLNEHWRAHGVKTAAWYRVLEWTPGNDGIGHPHLHVWLLCPYLEQDDLHGWWQGALLGAGCPAADVARMPRPDIRAVYDTRSSALELIKYLVKDITGQGEKLPPEVFAEAYGALDARRVTQASKGFIAKGKQAARACECGATLPRRVTKKRREPDDPVPKEQGRPDPDPNPTDDRSR